MPYRPLTRFLYRAPLLPLRSLSAGGPRLERHPLGETALALASPDLRAGLARGAGGARALDRYHRRAAFRPTPHGLFAGIGVGVLAARQRVRTGTPAAVLRVSWTRMADLGRALLHQPALRAQARLRHAPSVVMGAHTLVWLGFGGQGAFGDERRADLDALLETVVARTRAWTGWAEVRAAVASIVHGNDGQEDSDENGDDDGVGDGALDDLLVQMVEDGLLHVDLIPPLVGPDALAWMRARLGTITGADDLARRLDAVAQALDGGDLSTAQDELGAVPGAAGADAGVEGTLLFAPRPPPTLSRAAVSRAAALAPLLFRLQEALASPVAERTPAPALADALVAATETFGAGALDLGALVMGDYGVSPVGDDDDTHGGTHDPGGDPVADNRALYTLLVDRFTAAARGRAPEVTLSSLELEPLLPPSARPSTCELFLTPCRPRARERAGHGWLLGLHGPAGSSWGRFAFALGSTATALLTPLRDAELAARPAEQRLDVVFTPSEALADVCAHPPLRPAALAISGWPAEDVAAVTVGDLELCADPGALEPLALRTRHGQPVAPSALHRARSTTAPPGVWRLLVGWSLQRQHAPWAMTLGPLTDLEWAPRVSVDGFVVAPANWRIPARIAAGNAPARLVRAWRRTAGLPRFVQVGAEDELLPVDLEAPGAAADLAGQRRVHEIWPPLGDTPDESGRRFEAVVALIDHPEDGDGDDGVEARTRAAVAATAAAVAVPPPRNRAHPDPAAGWHTFKLFGAADRQDALLVDVIHPCIRAAREAGDVADWFFLRYIDGPGRRPHLRLRTRSPRTAAAAAFRRRLDTALAHALREGDVVTVETADYFPEAARFGGGDIMPTVHAVFDADSDRACALLAAEARHADEPGWPELTDDRVLLLVAAFDGTARALGLDAAARRALARRRRDAHAESLTADDDEAHARAFRAAKSHLRALLSGQRPASVGTALDDAEARLKHAAAGLAPAARDRILAPLLHLSAVRLLGPDRDGEIQGYTFWERTLESLDRHRHQPR